MSHVRPLLAGLVLGWSLVGCMDPGADGPESQAPSSSLLTEAPENENPSVFDRPAPAFAGKTVQGDRFDSSALDGQVVILNFWATWCAPCRVEIPHLIALHEEWKAEGVRIVGVSVDRADASVVRQFVEELGVPYPIVLDPEMDVARAYGGHYAFPTTFVIDREGRIHHRFMRAVGPADLRPAIAPLL